MEEVERIANLIHDVYNRELLKARAQRGWLNRPDLPELGQLADLTIRERGYHFAVARAIIESDQHCIKTTRGAT